MGSLSTLCCSEVTLYLTAKPEELSLKLEVVRHHTAKLARDPMPPEISCVCFETSYLMASDLGSGEMKCSGPSLWCFPVRYHDLFPCRSVLCLPIYMPVHMHKEMYVLIVHGFGFNIRFYTRMKMLLSFYCSLKGAAQNVFCNSTCCWLEAHGNSWYTGGQMSFSSHVFSREKMKIRQKRAFPDVTVQSLIWSTFVISLIMHIRMLKWSVMLKLSPSRYFCLWIGSLSIFYGEVARHWITAHYFPNSLLDSAYLSTAPQGLN